MLGEKIASSNIILFLSFQIAQKRQIGAVNHNFLSFFLTGKVFQPRIKSSTEKRHTASSRRAAHSSQTIGQWISKCYKSSSASSQRRHLRAREFPLFLSCSMCIFKFLFKIYFQIISIKYKKKDLFFLHG